ncbi:hypothetical protein THAOC_14131 [Thalassiosira oceanica]|uniref:RING-type domain-containing protein n=1 Tax=Thalassiosira oceanica TaxID=159749 RepID=K0SI63_THAOC|nr:hypothetical protein THAOC_14131 [Thalassiosira oceanica]|eukprot:EJK65065.1 hypothetical protein THAOC_14131 [Thalassiosira oceanica]
MLISAGALETSICGARQRSLPNDASCEAQRGPGQSSRRCGECVTAGNPLEVMTKGRTRPVSDDCPICQLPLPLDDRHSSWQPCCLAILCDGCILAAKKRGLMDSCPFCRAPNKPENEEAIVATIEKRVDAGDPWGMYARAAEYDRQKDSARAVEMYERSAALGEKRAHYMLGCIYSDGTDGVEVDHDKAISHFEAAAMEGHVQARFYAGQLAEDVGLLDTALQHWLIAASLGLKEALDEVKKMFMRNLATKAEYEKALRDYHGAAKEMSSRDRDEAAQA